MKPRKTLYLDVKPVITVPEPSPWQPLEPGETFTVEDGQRMVYRKGRLVRAEQLQVVTGQRTR